MSRRASPLMFLLGSGVSAMVAVEVARRMALSRFPDFFRRKVVIITGASRGIGKSLAFALAVRGAHLVLASRNEDQLKEVAKRCEALHRQIETLVVPTDVTDEAQLQRLIDRTLERFGRIDILINNAGIIQGGALVDLDPESIRQQIEVNVIGSVRLTQIVLKPMLIQKSGHIVLMASAAGRTSYPYFVPYSTTKHALIGFGDGLRRELAGTGIKVMTVNPGYVSTDMIDKVGVAYKKMGLDLQPPEMVARRTLEGLVLGLTEVNIGFIYTVSQYASVLIPFAVDLFWRLFPPRDFPKLAEEQHTK